MCPWYKKPETPEDALRAIMLKHGFQMQEPPEPAWMAVMDRVVVLAMQLFVVAWAVTVAGMFLFVLVRVVSQAIQG